MEELALARALHVLAVVAWIGGVAFVTTVLLPAVRRLQPSEHRLSAFHRFEQAFAWQARIWVTLAGLSGFWIVHRADMWWRFAEPRFWWMHAMVALWALFTAMLFVIEPAFLHRRMERSASPARDFRRMEVLHRLVLAAAVVTVLGAVAGSHGLM